MGDDNAVGSCSRRAVDVAKKKEPPCSLRGGSEFMRSAPQSSVFVAAVITALIKRARGLGCDSKNTFTSLKLIHKFEITEPRIQSEESRTQIDPIGRDEEAEQQSSAAKYCDRSEDLGTDLDT